MTVVYFIVRGLKGVNMLDQDQQNYFSCEFIKRYLEYGFGSMSKSEIDALVFYLISESKEIKNKTNYYIANKLKIPESKVKYLKLNSALKYNQASHKAVLANIVSRITNEIQKPEFLDGQVTITIEDPVEQRELEHAIKSIGKTIEYGLNKELFKISPISLFELVISNLENPEKEFKKIIQSQISDKNKLKTIINKTLTFRQKLNKVGEEINDKAGLIKLLGAASGALYP